MFAVYSVGSGSTSYEQAHQFSLKFFNQKNFLYQII